MNNKGLLGCSNFALKNSNKSNERLLRSMNIGIKQDFFTFEFTIYILKKY